MNGGLYQNCSKVLMYLSVVIGSWAFVYDIYWGRIEQRRSVSHEYLSRFNSGFYNSARVNLQRSLIVSDEAALLMVPQSQAARKKLIIQIVEDSAVFPDVGSFSLTLGEIVGFAASVESCIVNSICNEELLVFELQPYFINIERVFGALINEDDLTGLSASQLQAFRDFNQRGHL